MAQSIGGSPNSKLTSEQNEYYKLHKVLVDEFKEFIQENQKRHGINAHLFPPEKIIRTELYLKSRTSDKMRTKFFYQLLRAWDALAFDRYDLADADQAASDLNCYSYDGHSAVRLSDPVQIKLLGALAEAAAIPHQKDNPEIPIPERLRGENYWQWKQSPGYEHECQNRLARADSRKQSNRF